MFLLFEQFENEKKRLPVYQVFKKAFPMIVQVMDQIKRTKKNRLAIILQKLEAYFMLDVIAKKFASKHPDSPVYTIHDAYLVKEPDVEELDKLIKDELENQVGIRPSTKIKKLSPANLFMDLNKAIDLEIALLKEKARKKKPIESSDYKYFRLFENEIPKWNGEEVMTASVWAQVQNNPKYRPFLVDKSKMEKLKQIREERRVVKSLFQDSDLDQIGCQIELRKQVPPGYTVRHLFDFRERE
ncbi:hypothetical protein [Algoriphagus sp. AK58]|uniref:hypothetical protein n=1 Tax=Algoriphagus sp. AK58 TaxID=1406877 RepID=UPI00164FCF99|nr:hypothetical protein [Algoriphagus sp. AK58]